jgi:hypothetical protein
MFVMTRKWPSGAESRKEKGKELKLEELFRLLQERKEEQEEENRSPFTQYTAFDS